MTSSLLRYDRTSALTRHVPYRNVAEVLAHHAAARPGAVAICCENRSVSYLQLEQASNRLARAILAELPKGSRIAFLGKESELYYEVFFACAKCEMVLVPVNWRLATQEVEHILRD